MKKRSDLSAGEQSHAVATVILAGARASGDVLAEAHNVPSKAHIKVAGLPMISRVVSAVSESTTSNDVTIIGLDQQDLLQGLEKSPKVRFLPGADGPAASVYRALQLHSRTEPVLVTTCDHALLTPTIIDAFLAEAMRSEADLAVALAPRDVIERAYPDVARTYLRFGDGEYSSCNLFCLLTPKASKVVKFWQRAEQDRKRPWRIAWRFGVLRAVRILIGRPSIDRVFELVSEKLEVNVKPVILPFADAAVDVDTLADLALVERVLQERST